MSTTNPASWFKEEDDNGNEVAPVEPEKETETPADPQPEQKTNEEENPATGEQPPKEEELPFHKHPRFKQLINEKKELEARVSELSEFKQKVEPFLNQAGEAIPEWFRAVYGEDPNIWNAYNASENRRFEELEKKLRADLEAEKTTKAKEEEAINEFIKTEVDSLKKEGHQFDENELMKTVLDHKLFDSDGRLNFRAGLTILEAKGTNNVKQAAKKAIADKTGSTSGGADIPKATYQTSSTLRNSDWRKTFKSL